MKKDFSPVLYGAFLNCRTEEDVRLLLEDLCTYQELEQLSQRAAAAKLLIEGKTYAEIISETAGTESLLQTRLFRKENETESSFLEN